MLDEPEDFDYDDWSDYDDTHSDITCSHCHFDFEIDTNNPPTSCIYCDGDLD